MSKDSLTVEIFRDVVTPAAPINRILAGMEFIQGIAPQFTVVNTERKIRVGNTNDPYFNLDVDRWPTLPADFNIIATDRELLNPWRSEGNAVDGVRFPTGSSIVRGEWVNGLRVAVVRTSGARDAKHITAHEIGHLVNAEPLVSVSKEDPWHCQSVECLMHDTAEKILEEQRVVQKGLKRFREHRGWRRPEYTSQMKYIADDYCGGCREQVGMKSYFLAKAKAGEFVPDSIISRVIFSDYSQKW